MLTLDVALYIDTNTLIHLRDLKDLPWQELFAGVRSVQLYVAHCVIEELDRHKVNSNRRKRDRARAALRLIEAAVGSPTRSVLLRSEPVQVNLHVTLSPTRDWASFPHLDRARPDDHLVMEALCHEGGAAVFSHDSGPRIRAQLSGIRGVAPLDSWLLPDQITDDQQRIAVLERELEYARRTSPNIRLRFTHPLEDGVLKFHIPRLPPFNRDLATRLAEVYLMRHPVKDVGPTDDLFGLTPALSGISSSDAENYFAEFEAFEGRVKRFYLDLHDTVASAAHVLHIPYAVENDSGVAAQGLRVEVMLETDGGHLIADEKSTSRIIGRRLLKLPKPPKAPKPRFGFPNIPLFEPERRDPTKFYWFDQPGPGMASALQCEDFRAKRTWDDEICVWIFSQKDGPFSGHVRLHVSASNMTSPVTLSAGFKLAENAANWSDPDVLAVLPDDVQGALSKQS